MNSHFLAAKQNKKSTLLIYSLESYFFRDHNGTDPKNVTMK